MAHELPKQRVLLVDNVATSRAGCALMHLAGLEVIEARDAHDGYALAVTEQPN